MAKSGGGSIVNNASVAGLRGSGNVVYSGSKWAVCGMTKSVAIQVAAQGIRCNTVCPGLFPTEMTTARYDSPPDSFATSLRNLQYPARRTGLLPEIVAPVLFLLGDGATFMTGLDVAVDGGLTAGYGAPKANIDPLLAAWDATRPKL